MSYVSLSAELGVTSGQLKTWQLEQLAAGSAATQTPDANDHR